MDTTTQARSPSNKSDADVVLLSSNKVRFSCHKNVLSIATPFFADMFSLEQRDNQAHDVRTGDGTPAVPVSEDSKVLYHLLLLLYPVPPPKKYTLTTTASLLGAGRKCDLAVVRHNMEIALSPHIQAQPLKVFAVACHHRVLTMVVYKRPHFCYDDDMKDISAGAYFRLLEYLRLDGKVVSGFRFIHSNEKATPQSTRPEISVALDWSLTLSRSKTARDVIVRSEGPEPFEFEAHSLVLSLPVASRRFTDMLDNEITDSTGFKTIALPEESYLVLDMLRCCYGSLPFRSGHGLFSLLDVASNYGLSDAAELHRAVMHPLLTTHPLESYFAAASHGWDEEAAEAARNVAKKAAEFATYVSQMESATALDYYRLLRFCRRFGEMERRLPKRLDSENFIQKENVEKIDHDSVVVDMSLRTVTSEGYG